MVIAAPEVYSGVMPGLHPRIHDDTPQSTSVLLSLHHGLMDCRLEAGNDREEVGAQLSEMGGTRPAMTGRKAAILTSASGAG